MNTDAFSMAPILMVDIAGSALMIVFSILCVCHAASLKRHDPQNILWTYLLWFSSGLMAFSVSRSAGHIVKHLFTFMGMEHYWIELRPVSGSLNTMSFVLVGGITLFFSNVYATYRKVQESRNALERAHEQIRALNIHLEKRVEDRTKELFASEKKYRQLFENSKDLLFICDEKGRLLDINDTGMALLGIRDRKQVLSKPFLSRYLFKPDAEALKRELMEKEHLKDVEVILKNTREEELTALLSATLRKNGAGRIEGFEGTLKDITQRKQMERQLLQADKLASLGQLSAGVAHEINNPLGLILGYARLVLKAAEPASQTHEDVKIIEKHAINCKKIVEDLLKFSRSAGTTKAPGGLNDLVREVVTVVENKFKLENVRIETTLDPEIPPVTVDPDKMKQVFMNLIMNARQAITGEGVIAVATVLAPDRRSVQVSVSDTGSGIPPDVLHKIFDPFFTTKPTGMGTGLGLSVSYGIIKDHEGEILVESETGRGSTFTILLPVIPDRSRSMSMEIEMKKTAASD